jgi:trimeric autotransporter adhesin
MANVGTAAAGKTLIGAGNGKSPTYANIGTNSGLTAHGVVVAEGNSAFTVATPGTSGYILTSNGASSDPTFQNITSTGAATTITGNSGGALSPTAGNWNILTANSTTKFVGSGSTLTLDFGIDNLILGSSATSLAGGGGDVNTAVGYLAGDSLSSGLSNAFFGSFSGQQTNSGSENAFFGYGSGRLVTQGNANTFIGSNCGAFTTISILNTAVGQGALGTYTTGADGSGSNACLGASSLAALTEGINNTACGTDSLSAITTGFYNIAIGYGAGRSHTVADSSNINIGNSGTVGDSNVTRIGTQGSGSGQQNKCFIAGVTGVTVAASAPVGVNSSGQFSSLGFGTSGQTLVSGGAGVSPSWSDNLDYKLSFMLGGM